MMNARNKTAALMITLLATVITAACDRHPDNVLGSEEMARLLADIHRAEVVAETNTRTYNDSMRRVLRQSVYAAHGVTSATVDTSLSWYGYNMERYLKVYDRVIEILQKDMEKARERAGSSTETSTISVTFEGDSVDVWTGERFHRWNHNQPSDIITFFISPDHNMAAGDAYTLNQKLIGTTRPVEIIMVAGYNDNTYEYIARQLNGDGWHDTRLPLDPDKTLRNLYGSISYKPTPSGSAFVDSITLVRTRVGGSADAEARRHLTRFTTNHRK